MVSALIAGLAGQVVLIFFLKRLRPSGWQIANFLFFAANVLAVRNIPRLDNGNVMLQPLNYLTPAPYAFSIWAVIYLWEAAFVVWQVLLPMQRRKPILARASPWWCAANACQVAWCFAFRPQLDSAALGWVSAVCLSGIALSLNRVHEAIAFEGDFGQAMMMYVPLTLHFGWVSAAALVNWNGYAARCDLPHSMKVAVLLLSLALATGLGCALTLRRRSALYGCTVAWAVAAVSVQTTHSARMAEAFGSSLTIYGNLELALAALPVAAALAVVVTSLRSFEGLQESSSPRARMLHRGLSWAAQSSTNLTAAESPSAAGKARRWFHRGGSMGM